MPRRCDRPQSISLHAHSRYYNCSLLPCHRVLVHRPESAQLWALRYRRYVRGVGLLIVLAVLHTSLRSAAGPSGRTAGRALCLCCVVFCLPPRLWVTIYTLPQVHLWGRVRTSSLATVRHQVYDWRLDFRTPLSELRPLQSHWLLLLVLFPPFTT